MWSISVSVVSINVNESFFLLVDFSVVSALCKKIDSLKAQEGTFNEVLLSKVASSQW